ncbi:MAG: hypothetical protein OXN27_15650 [Candidatus Poribacteria bacterium]|nr:hypothetical protein [Candidatus Poribacteria bacterium]
MKTRMIFASLVLAVVLSLGVTICQIQADPTISSSASAGFFKGEASVSPGIDNADGYNQTTTYNGDGGALASIVRLLGGEDSTPDSGSIWAKVTVKWALVSKTESQGSTTVSGSVGASHPSGVGVSGGVSHTPGGTTTTTTTVERVRETSSGGRSDSVSGGIFDVKVSHASGEIGGKSTSSSDSYP